MLIPRNLLLFLVGALVVPAAAVGGLAPDTSAVAALLVVLVLIITAADAIAAWQHTGTGLSFAFPEVLRLAKGRPANLDFVAVDSRSRPPGRSLRLGLALPVAVRTVDEDERSAWLAPGVAHTLFRWPIVGLTRGNFRLDRIYFREDSPWGLWSVRRSQAAGCELRVYPDLRTERRQAAAVFLHRQGVGTHAQRLVGRGRDFEKLRDYIPGDSIEDINWKATARRQRPVSKVFQVERTQEVYALVDASRLSGRPAQEGQPATALERYVSTALLLCQVAQRQGDLFGLVTFAAGVDGFLRAKNGAAHFNRCREAIYALEPAAVSPDFDELASFLRLRLRRRALLFILTALDDPLQAEGLVKAAERIGRQHLVIVGTLRPAGAAPLLTDPDGGAGVQTTEDVYQRLAGHLQWQRLRERESLLRRSGVRVALLDPARMTGQLISQYLDVKRRQLI